MKYNIISPDGFSISIEGGFKTVYDALNIYQEWKKGFQAQGYCRSVEGRIPIKDLDSRCIFRIQDPLNFEPYCNITMKEFYSAKGVNARSVAVAIDEANKAEFNRYESKIKMLETELNYYKGVTDKDEPVKQDRQVESIKVWLFDMFVENFEGFENSNAAYERYARHILDYAERHNDAEELFYDIQNAKKELFQEKDNCFEFVRSIHSNFYEKFGVIGTDFMLTTRLEKEKQK
jgi:hypothetical protein